MKTPIGVDLHKCSLTTMVLDEQGKALERKDIPSKCRDQIQQYFGSYTKYRRTDEADR